MIENCTDFANHSQYIFYEWVSTNNGLLVYNCYDVRTTMPHQLIPMQYQGWLLLAFLLFGTIAVCYGLYIVARDPMDNPSKTDPNCYYYMTEDEINKM
jgi:hypothetical protein